ncbi:MAG: trypsin-like peptidase domain-containing protein [Clostridia bacterium]|nr:trypsin-like peptidase domain-containing protein [Clostridia bacterium]
MNEWFPPNNDPMKENEATPTAVPPVSPVTPSETPVPPAVQAEVPVPTAPPVTEAESPVVSAPTAPPVTEAESPVVSAPTVPPVMQAEQPVPPAEQPQIPVPPSAVPPAAQRPPYPPTYYAGTPYASRYTPPYTRPVAEPFPPKKKNRGESVLIAVLAVVCAVSVLVSVGLGVYVLTDKNKGNDPTTSVTDHEGENVNNNGPTLQISDLQEIDDGGMPTSEIVEKNVNATVVLTMYHKASTVNYYSSFFGYYGGNNADSLTEVSAASGIIMSEDGYIITNSHCVFDEEYEMEYARLDVTLYDGRVFENARIVGYDRSTDLAVIKIDANDLTPAEFGDSSLLSLGDRVVTLGNSGGLSWSVSQGILSGQARDVYEDTGYAIKCLQVDAVINPGSSGGPLINAYGQVVGVNSAKIVLTGYEGLGFSIPINEAKPIIDDLIKYGYATGRVSLGILGRTVTSIGYEGFIIEEIAKESALVGTDAKVGDIITHINGVRVMNYEEMRAELTKNTVGDIVTLTLIRLDNQTRKVTEFNVKVRLGEMK